MEYKYHRINDDGTILVDYGIIPDHGTPIFPGDTVTVAGWASFFETRAMITWPVQSIGFQLSDAFSAYANVYIAPGKYSYFSMTFTVPDAFYTKMTSRFSDSATYPSIDLFPLPNGGRLNNYDPQSYTAGAGTDVERIRFGKYRLAPRILAMDFERATPGGAWADDGQYLQCKALKIAIHSQAVQSDITKATITCAGSDGTSRSVTLSRDQLAAALTAGGYSETKPGIFAGFVSALGVDYTLTLTLGDDYDQARFADTVMRSFARLHLSGAKNGGAAVGMFSSATVAKPKFEVADTHESFFYGGISGVTNYVDEVEVGDIVALQIYNTTTEKDSYILGTAKSVSSTGIGMTSIAKIDDANAVVPRVLVTPYRNTTNAIAPWCELDYTSTWSVANTNGVHVGDIVALRVYDTTLGLYTYIISRVDSVVSDTSIRSTSASAVNCNMAVKFVRTNSVYSNADLITWGAFGYKSQSPWLVENTTGEVPTGGHWIDGKLIYRYITTIALTMPCAAWSEIGRFPSIVDRIVSDRTMIYDLGGRIIGSNVLPYPGDATFNMGVVYNGTSIISYFGDGWISGRKFLVYIDVEYTKADSSSDPLLPEEGSSLAMLGPIPNRMIARTDYIAMMAGIEIPEDEGDGVQADAPGTEPPGIEGEPPHSENYDKVESYHRFNIWNAQMVRNAVGRWITAEEAQGILSDKGE